MKKLIAALALTTIAMTTMAAGCSAPQSNGEQPHIKATNVTIVEIARENNVGKFYIFDLERDGKMLTCTTTESIYNSGVNCMPKENTK